jgi:hypothetical protein
MTGIFERMRHSQFAEPIWQPVIFALLLLLISITLVLIITTQKGPHSLSRRIGRVKENQVRADS